MIRVNISNLIKEQLVGKTLRIYLNEFGPGRIFGPITCAFIDYDIGIGGCILSIRDADKWEHISLLDDFEILDDPEED